MYRSRDHDSVRRSYDAVAEQYVASFGGELAGKPLDRALLACLLEQSGRQRRTWSVLSRSSQADGHACARGPSGES
jgi:hypothetical protein